MVRNLIKKIMIGIVAVSIAGVSLVSNVWAEEDTDDINMYDGIVSSSGVVWSEQEFDGWELEWSAGDFYDILNSIERDDVKVNYCYDDVENRISKKVNNHLTSYYYDSNNRLISETDGNYMIIYVYSINENTGYVELSGFKYNGDEYKYIFDENNSICSIIDNEGREQVRYEYDYGVCEQVLGLNENGQWVNMEDDESFIGNINPYRYVSQYLDRETGWYWVGRYYSQTEGRFIDGIDETTADEMRTVYGDSMEIFLKTYTVGRDINRPLSKRSAGTIPDVQYIAGVIYAESSVVVEDQQAVAWVIKNRIDATWGEFANQSTAIEVVKAPNQFTAPNYGTTSSPTWVSAVDLAVKLHVNKKPVDSYPSGYRGQYYFNSVGTFLENTKYENGNFIYNDSSIIYTISIVGYGNVDSEEKLGDISEYSGKRNVFFDAGW